MMRTNVTVSVAPLEGRTGKLLVPVGLPTPHQLPVGFEVTGGDITLTGEETTGQFAALVTPEPGEDVVVRYAYRDKGPGYPDALFHPRRNRFTSAAQDLMFDAINIADAQVNGHAAIQALVNAAAEKFRYAHPEVRFNDGCEEVPYLACGLTEGSCVDINTYLIASLRAAGYEAGYVTGYFFPEEKNGSCDDMHCWVVTRHDGVVLEWDIAHHLKMGTRDVSSGLNPKPGDRVAVAHSMGLSFPDLGISCEKLIGEPAWVGVEGRLEKAEVTIRREVVGRKVAA
ncbi:transglutaminase-like domain-containing protein [Roseibium sediminicola]|uniref:Transglutaminase-like domain-containing protein n=1 Tax=Roseibium sediminicola TaxID=2933272 RepID=A0ABT0GTC9_9HYPH|nr:transglutaminase-like domain-containing protein [Roseibium sp. CAU 1639]MCK7612692.1 transglutaminase-like domain-containing protein [Roseibium sp. CAU 1639]